MAKRLAFNGGELSPELALRSDLDVYMRGCACIENFDVSQQGGVKRRRGMRPFADAMEGSRIIPYIYSTSERYIVEMNSEHLRIYTPNGELVQFPQADGTTTTELPCHIPHIELLRHKQVNSLLILTNPSYQPMVLKRNSAGEWTFEPFEFKSIPWREEGHRDEPVTVSRNGAGEYSVTFTAELSEVEQELCPGDLLRASYYTTQQDRFEYAANLVYGVQQITNISDQSNIAAGTKLAIRSDESMRYYSCTAEWKGSEHFINGLTSPENYPDQFLAAESMAGFDSVAAISGLSSGMSYNKGDRLKVESGYWEYYTCIRPFTSADYVTGSNSPDDYPGHFVRGLAIGNAAPCKGTWQFYCSGAWIGEYEVRRSYEGGELADEWETRDSSFSRIGAASNTLLTGDEQEEECYLRLFITRSRYEDANLINGFPADSCSNRLVVSPYKHDMLLRYSTVEEDDGTIVSESWTLTDPIRIDFAGTRSIIDWSWQAFSDKYGYPALCDIYNQRLVFAATEAQPQTIWMSCTDDLNNFHTGKLDTSALALTMSTTTQNRICWIMAQGARLLLGTADAEHTISSGGSQSITYANARIDNHGFVGSADTPALMATDKVVYVERGSGRLYQYGYDFASDAYVSRDLTIFSDHILRDGGGVKDGTFLRKPDAKAFFVLTNGTAALMTYNSMHEVNCWHRYKTEGQIEYCAALPNGTKADSLFLIVQRKSGRYIEVIDEQSPYSDRYEHDYTSTILTNPLTFADARATPKPSGKVHVYLMESALAEGIEVTADGEEWSPLDRDEYLPAGWNYLLAVAKWDEAPRIGLRVTGERSLHILAMQG